MAISLSSLFSQAPAAEIVKYSTPFRMAAFASGAFLITGVAAKIFYQHRNLSMIIPSTLGAALLTSSFINNYNLTKISLTALMILAVTIPIVEGVFNIKV